MVALAGNQPANRENKLLPKFSSSVSTLPEILPDGTHDYGRVKMYQMAK
jgi:hypothetical protein